MGIPSTKISVNNNINKPNNSSKTNKNTNFKGLGALAMNGAGAAMNWIENGGFATSFLIQDTAGMTLPRTREGLYRDRDKKKTKFKDLNFKEALEVGIREFLSGPLMMFTPFVVFAITKKHIGKSTFTNTGLLKKVGNIFTETTKNKKSADTISNIKNSFYKNSVRQMVHDTIPSIKDTPKANELITKTTENFEKLDNLELSLKNAKGKTFGQWIMSPFTKFKSEKDVIKESIKQVNGEIVSDLNDAIMTNSSNFELAGKVRLNNETYRTSDSIGAIRGYAEDILKNKNVEDITEQTAKNFEKTSMVKRVFSTALASVATIGATSIVPKIYALLNPVAPGVASEPQNVNKTVVNKSANSNKKTLNFKGNPLKQLQFDGNQFTPLLMTALSAGGLIGPRIKTAVERAPIDEKTGKKNLIEIPEIVTRDVTSTAAVVFGVPVLSKAMINLYQKSSGFVLTSDPTKNKTLGRKILDTLNPMSGNVPFSNEEIKDIYGKVNNKEKLVNFANFIDKNDGSLVKVFNTLKNGASSFAGSIADFDSLKGLNRKDANAKIIDAIKNTFDDAKVEHLMKPSKLAKNGEAVLNDMHKRARGLNSTPKLINTIFLVPAFLGVILPKIVYGITAKNRNKQVTNMVVNNNQNIQNNNFKVSLKGTAFDSMHHIKKA